MRYTVLIVIAVTVVALLLRLPQLSQRPMHTDEAVHAIKFGQLLEKNYYRYNPCEFHGPTLNYFTLISAWLSNADNIADVNENTLRIVPVVFGVILVLLPLFVRTALGNTAALFAALLTAISPAMVYYSRYYIMEILLVCFTFGVVAFAYRYISERRATWAIAVGACVGLVQATKETSIIAFFAMFLALVITHWMHRRDWSSEFRFSSMLNPVHLALAFGTAVAVAVLFFSSFFTHWQGVVDAVKTYAIYFDRGSGNSFHIHPWYYYLQILLFWQESGGPVWSDAFVLVLALVGAVSAIRSRNKYSFDVHLGRFIAFYTIIITVVYAGIPYKTPWNLLSFYHGVIILAGLGVAVLMQTIPSGLWRKVTALLMAIGCVHLLWQAYLASFRYEENQVNPYVYAHPLSGVKHVADIVHDYSEVDEDGKNMRIDVICPESEVWPLRWYLRAYPNFGFWTEVVDTIPPARLILATPDHEEKLKHKFFDIPPPGQKHMYLPLYQEHYFIRADIELNGYVRKDLWDAYQYRQIR